MLLSEERVVGQQKKKKKKKRTSGVQVRVAASVARAEEGRAGVAVLGLGRADGQAADLAVRAVHHLHKLTTPGGHGEIRKEHRQKCVMCPPGGKQPINSALKDEMWKTPK